MNLTTRQVLEQLDILAAEDRAKRQRIDRRIRRDDGKVSISVDADEQCVFSWSASADVSQPCARLDRCAARDLAGRGQDC